MKIKVSKNGFGKKALKAWKVKEGFIINFFGTCILALNK